MTNLQETIGHLDAIGSTKRGMPWSKKCWTSELGLYVQCIGVPGVTGYRIKAGGKFRSYLEADHPSLIDAMFGDYVIRKFDQKTWERRFAHLVLPTAEIVMFVNNCRGSQLSSREIVKIQRSSQHFLITGKWIELIPNKDADWIHKFKHEALVGQLGVK